MNVQHQGISSKWTTGPGELKAVVGKQTLSADINCGNCLYTLRRKPRPLGSKVMPPIMSKNSKGPKVMPPIMSKVTRSCQRTAKVKTKKRKIIKQILVSQEKQQPKL